MNLKWNRKEDGEHRLKLNLLNRKHSIFLKTSIVAVLLTGLTFNLGFAKELDNDPIKKIYHIYVNDLYLGAVSDKQAVEDLLQQQQESANSQFTNLKINVDDHIKLIPEQVFNHETNDQETLEKLKETMVVEASAYALLIDNKPITYFKDSKDYDEALRLLKRQFVSEQEYNQWMANQSSKKALPALKVGESRVKAISIEQKISGKETKVSPSKILTPAEAVTYLMTGSIEKDVYEVQEGDVLGSIAKKHSLKTAELLALNPGMTEESLLQIGQQLNVTIPKAFVTVNVIKEAKTQETIVHKNVIEQDNNMYKGESKVKQEGSDGKKEASYEITEQNGVLSNKKVLEETVLVEAVDHIEIQGTKVISSRGTGEFAWPTVGGYISSYMGERWGEYHRGIDIARPSNYNILAADNGVVVSTGVDGSYGNKIIINHNNGSTTLYGHLSKINVSVGQVVPKGFVIGIMGSTGNSTGTHLHFEVEQNGSLINPLTVVSR